MGIDTFLSYISKKVNVIAQLEFELAHYDAVVWHLSHYTMGTPQKEYHCVVYT